MSNASNSKASSVSPLKKAEHLPLDAEQSAEQDESANGFEPITFDDDGEEGQSQGGITAQALQEAVADIEPKPRPRPAARPQVDTSPNFDDDPDVLDPRAGLRGELLGKQSTSGKSEDGRKLQKLQPQERKFAHLPPNQRQMAMKIDQQEKVRVFLPLADHEKRSYGEKLAQGFILYESVCINGIYIHCIKGRTNLVSMEVYKVLLRAAKVNPLFDDDYEIIDLQAHRKKGNRTHEAMEHQPGPSFNARPNPLESPRQRVA